MPARQTEQSLPQATVPGARPSRLPPSAHRRRSNTPARPACRRRTDAHAGRGLPAHYKRGGNRRSAASDVFVALEVPAEFSPSALEGQPIMAVVGMQRTIVIVEDDGDLCTLLEYNLCNSGYKVVALHCLDGALEAIKAHSPDLIVLDVMLPDGDGLEFCRSLRADAAIDQVPILFLTARAQELDRVLGLEIGGDDYITKPFSPRELLARIKAHLRRVPARGPKRLLAAKGLEIDFDARRATLHGDPLELTATEFALLEFLAEHPGKAYTRQQLISRVWSGRVFVTPRNIDVHIRRLRERIEQEPKHPRWIQTVRGFGYRFEIPA